MNEKTSLKNKILVLVSYDDKIEHFFSKKYVKDVVGITLKEIYMLGEKAKYSNLIYKTDVLRIIKKNFSGVLKEENKK